MWELVAVILVAALIGHRAARAVSMDDVGEPLRRWTRDFERLKPDSHPRRWLVGLIKCPHCIGFWMTLAIALVVSAILLDVDFAVDVVIAAAAAGLQSLFATYAQEDQVAMEFKEPEPEGTSEAGKSDTTPVEGYDVGLDDRVSSDQEVES